MAASGDPKQKTPAQAVEAVEQAMGLVDVGGFDDIEEDIRIVDGDDEDVGDEQLNGEEIIASSESSGSDEFALILAELETMMMDEAFNSKVPVFKPARTWARPWSCQ